jgi:hypothetical protein
MTIDLLVQFEDSIKLEQDMVQIVPPLTGSPQTSDLAGDQSPVIDFPSQIKLNEINQIRVTKLQDRQRIALSDGNIATFDPETLFVTARRLGSFEIQVLDRRKRQAEGAALAAEVVASKGVEVIL